MYVCGKGDIFTPLSLSAYLGVNVKAFNGIDVRRIFRSCFVEKLSNAIHKVCTSNEFLIERIIKRLL